MKKSAIFVASLTAASATATSSISSSKVRISSYQDDGLKKKDENSNSSRKVAAPKSSDKFAPKFDGLRFIETLVTAHR